MFPNIKMPKRQSLHQRFDRDCGVVVFAAIAGIPYEEICQDLPEAHLGTVSVTGWQAWLTQRGFEVLKQDGCPDNIVPCAHLVALVENGDDCHWIYRDEEGNVHDPDPAFGAMPADDPRMRELLFYELRITTLSVLKR